MRKILFVWIAMLLLGCNPDQNKTSDSDKTYSLVNKGGNTIKTRFNPPKGFKRNVTTKKSFSYFLQNLKLKPDGTPVYLYNGSIKSNSVHEAVIDREISNKDLHQCADAVIRLRAEFLYQQKRYNEINFGFTNGFECSYSKWSEGYRIQVNNNRAEWIKTESPNNSFQSFNAYLEQLYIYAGTISLSRDMKMKDFGFLEIGDVLIQGGSPGHAVIVVDKADNPETGDQLIMLAQSYMPAQQIQILKNENDEELSPWYEMKRGKILTPEWSFYSSDLKYFE